MTRRTCRDCQRFPDGICPKHEYEAESIFDGDYEDRDTSGRLADIESDRYYRTHYLGEG